MAQDWRLWQSLAQKSLKFGDPTNFLSKCLQLTVEAFTTIFWSSEFMVLYEKLSHDRLDTAAQVSLTESNCLITLSVPP